MTLTIIGLGLHDEKDITVRGLESVKEAEAVYLEYYTSVLSCSVGAMEKLYGKKIILADREMVEQKADETILKDSLSRKTAFLVVGDPMCATTHLDLVERAREKGIEVSIIPNASVFGAVGITGLQVYKFGKTASIPFFARNSPIDTPLRILSENQSIGAHTLFLLDLDPPNGKFLSIPEAIGILLAGATRVKEKGTGKESKVAGFGPTTFCIGCSRLGGPDAVVKAGSASALQFEEFGKEPHCLIVPGPLHFMEEEAVARFKKKT